MPRRSVGIAARGLLLALCCLAGVAAAAYARTSPEAMAEIALADLPRGSAGGLRADPQRRSRSDYDRDGVVFGNRERLLPAKPRAYYHEYTVRTPGVKNRGARRLVCGGPSAHPTCAITPTIITSRSEGYANEAA